MRESEAGAEREARVMVETRQRRYDMDQVFNQSDERDGFEGHTSNRCGDRSGPAGLTCNIIVDHEGDHVSWAGHGGARLGSWSRTPRSAGATDADAKRVRGVVGSFEISDGAVMLMAILLRAVRRETREACARVADGCARSYPHDGDCYGLEKRACESVAGAIRKLATQKGDADGEGA